MLLLMTMLSFVFIKHITIPLSDPLYFGLSMLCLLAGALAVDRKGPPRYGLLLAEVLIAIAAISIRTVGIALIPSILYNLLPTGLFSRLRQSWLKPNKLTVWSGVTIFLFLCASSLIITQTRYFQESMEVYQRVEPLRLATLKLYDWGELAANIPVSKLPSAAHPGGDNSWWIGFYPHRVGTLVVPPNTKQHRHLHVCVLWAADILAVPRRSLLAADPALGYGLRHKIPGKHLAVLGGTDGSESLRDSV